MGASSVQAACGTNGLCWLSPCLSTPTPQSTLPAKPCSGGKHCFQFLKHSLTPSLSSCDCFSQKAKQHWPTEMNMIKLHMMDHDLLLLDVATSSWAGFSDDLAHKGLFWNLHMFTAFFRRAKNWRSSKHPSSAEQIISSSIYIWWNHLWNISVNYSHTQLCRWISYITVNEKIHTMRFNYCCGCCSVTQSCLTLCNPMDCSMPGFPVLHHLPEHAQTQVHWVGNTIQPSHPLLSPSSPTFNLSQHQSHF